MIRITYIGAAFLSILALVPTAITALLNIDPMLASYYGGTGLLIVVSVVLESIQRADSQLVMHNYPSILSRE
jgi:preprotein translocase subunit SecY